MCGNSKSYHIQTTLKQEKYFGNMYIL